MRSKPWRTAMAAAWLLAMALFPACGPGVGGTGTGAAVFDAFQVSAASVCGGSIAGALSCPQSPGTTGPLATGTAPVRFVDDAGQVMLELDGNLATLDATCQRLRFNGEFGRGPGGAEGFFGSYAVDGNAVSRLAALSAALAATGGALTIELRDVDGRVVVNPVLLRPVGSVVPVAKPC